MSHKKRKHGQKKALQMQKQLRGRKVKPLKLHSLSSPFEGLEQNQVIQILKNAGQNLHSSFEKTLQDIQEKLLLIDPLQLLSVFAFYMLAHPAGTDPEVDSTDPDPILQHHVEVLQALILRYPREAFEANPVLPEDVTDIKELLQETTLSFQMRRLSNLDISLDSEQLHKLYIQEHMRGYTQAIRNWGYVQQMLNTVLKLFEPLEEIIQKKIGVRISNIFAMATNIVTLLEDRLNEHINRIRYIFTTKTTLELVKKYIEEFGYEDKTVDEFMEIVKVCNWNLEAVQSCLLSHSDLQTIAIYTLTLDEFMAAYPSPVDRSVLKRILGSWSLSFGDLAGDNTEHFFMKNPIWEKPLIRLTDDLFHLPIPGLFVSFCLELAEAIITPFEDLQRKYEHRRAVFLEEETEQLFRIAFPGATICRGSLWTDSEDNKQYENDVLVLIDAYLILVEAKSGRLSDRACRGEILRLMHDIKELIVAPSQQAKRFAEFLQRNPGKHQFRTRKGQYNEIDTSGVKETIVLSTTLDYVILSTFQSELKEARLIPENESLAPVIALSELEIIFELLEGVCQKLHYFSRRSQFERNANFFGDETDLLGFYLDTGFNVGQAEFAPDINLWLWGTSKILDPYFTQTDTGIPAEKPKLKLTPWWDAILAHLESRKFPGWTQIGVTLLNFSFDEQVLFERMFRSMQKSVEKKWQIEGHQNTAVLTPGPQQKRPVLVGFAYKQVDVEKRNRMMQNAASVAMEENESNLALLIGQDVDRKEDLPYSVLAVFYR